MIRLSRKAQDEASILAARLEEIIRFDASMLAESEHAEFADENHVKEAYRLVILRLAAKSERR